MDKPLEREFRGMRFTDPGPPLQSSAIEALEGSIGIRLPEAYREFLLKVNGGCPRPSGYKLLGEPEPDVDATIRAMKQNDFHGVLETLPRRIERFSGIGTDYFSSLDVLLSLGKVTLLADEEPEEPMVVVGFDDQRTSISMSLCPEFYEHIYVIWDDVGPLSELSDNLIARSFDELLKRLFPARTLVLEGYEATEEELRQVYRLVDE